MTKWRITEITHYPGTKKESKTYLVEKRFLGFLWWYDPFDDGMYSDGYFGSFDKALEAISWNKGSYLGKIKINISQDD